jgi:hypothetical protein
MTQLRKAKDADSCLLLGFLFALGILPGLIYIILSQHGDQTVLVSWTPKKGLQEDYYPKPVSWVWIALPIVLSAITIMTVMVMVLSRLQ